MKSLLRRWREWRCGRLRKEYLSYGSIEHLLCPRPASFADRLLVFRTIKRYREIRDKLRKIEEKLAKT